MTINPSNSIDFGALAKQAAESRRELAAYQTVFLDPEMGAWEAAVLPAIETLISVEAALLAADTLRDEHARLIIEREHWKSQFYAAVDRALSAEAARDALRAKLQEAANEAYNHAECDGCASVRALLGPV